MLILKESTNEYEQNFYSRQGYSWDLNPDELLEIEKLLRPCIQIIPLKTENVRYISGIEPGYQNPFISWYKKKMGKM